MEIPPPPPPPPKPQPEKPKLPNSGKLIIWIIAIGAGLFAYGRAESELNLLTCNVGPTTRDQAGKGCQGLFQGVWCGLRAEIGRHACRRIVDQDWVHSRVTNPDFQALLQQHSDEKKVEVAAKEARREADRQERREREIREANRLSIDDVVKCRFAIENSAHDRRSIRFETTVNEERETGVIRFSGTNAFGGRVTNRYRCSK